MCLFLCCCGLVGLHCFYVVRGRVLIICCLSLWLRLNVLLFINSVGVMLCTSMLFVLYWNFVLWVDVAVWVWFGWFCVLVLLLFDSSCWLF